MIFSFCLHPERGANLAQSSPVPASQHPCTTSRVGFPRKPHLGHALDGKGYSYPDFGLHSNSVSDDTSLISLCFSSHSPPRQDEQGGPPRLVDTRSQDFSHWSRLPTKQVSSFRRLAGNGIWGTFRGQDASSASERRLHAVASGARF